MSAYVVDREHIQYLIDSALRICRIEHSHSFNWYHGKELQRLDSSNATEIGQMLWDENIASVAYRYPDIKDGGSMPGKPVLSNAEGIDEDHTFIWQVASIGYDWIRTWNMAQVLKACDCYEYQSCEHPEWETSNAKAFIDGLRRHAWHHVPGYDEAAWGAPTVPADPRRR